jgi:hypothetical protein
MSEDIGCVWSVKKWGTGQDKTNCPVFDAKIHTWTEQNKCWWTGQVASFL